MAAAAVTRPEGRRGRPLGGPRSACTAGAVSSLPRCDKAAWGGLLQVRLWLGPVLLEVGAYHPTAQTSLEEAAATPRRVSPTPWLGLGTLLQLVPVQCAASVWVELVEVGRYSPTAQTS